MKTQKISQKKTYRQSKTLCHMLQVLGYKKAISLDSFRKPNFKLIADILYWLCKKMDSGTTISPNINGEIERVNFLKNTLSLLVSKTRVNINPKNIYFSDYRSIPELIKIISLLYKGKLRDKEDMTNCGDFTLPSKFDKRKTKDLAKSITRNGKELYNLIGRENFLNEKMDGAIGVLESVLKDYNNSSGKIERHVEKLIEEQKVNNKEILGYVNELEKKEMELIDRIRRKKMEKERMEKKLKTLSNIKPAYVQEMESCEKVLEKLFQVYLDKMRNLDYLEDCFDKINCQEKLKNKKILNYLEKMQVQIQKNEEKMFENNIDDIQIKNMNDFPKKFMSPNPIIEEGVEDYEEEEDEDDDDDDGMEEEENDYVF